MGGAKRSAYSIGGPAPQRHAKETLMIFRQETIDMYENTVFSKRIFCREVRVCPSLKC